MAPPGSRTTLGHLGDRADVRVLALVDRDEQHALAVGDVDRQRHGHVREDDDVFQGNQQQVRHKGSFIQSLMLLQRMK